METHEKPPRPETDPDGAEGARVALTPRAVEMVLAAMRQDGVTGYALRIGVHAAGCSGTRYQLEFSEGPQPGDAVVESGGVRIVIDRESLPFLRGVTIDYVTSLHGEGFKFLTPAPTAACGCGSSGCG